MSKPSAVSELVMQTDAKPSLSFCVTCMNRGDQLKATLEQNLKLIEGLHGAVELCLVNFIKDDEGEALHGWISSIPSSPSFRYHVCRELPAWHASIAKNTAHRAANGQYLINLDCDNFLAAEELDDLLGAGGRLARQVYSGFSGSLEKLVRKRWFGLRTTVRLRTRHRAEQIREDGSIAYDGTYGRIGMHREIFFGAGGYDESLPPMGGQDSNLLRRVLNLWPTLELRHRPSVLLPMENCKQDSMRNTAKPNEDWKALSERSIELTRTAIKTGKLIANEGKSIGLRVESQS